MTSVALLGDIASEFTDDIPSRDVIRILGATDDIRLLGARDDIRLLGAKDDIRILVSMGCHPYL